eukprot:1482013-Amphidinium_carterae.1
MVDERHGIQNVMVEDTTLGCGEATNFPTLACRTDLAVHVNQHPTVEASMDEFLSVELRMDIQGRRSFLDFWEG